MGVVDNIATAAGINLLRRATGVYRNAPATFELERRNDRGRSTLCWKLACEHCTTVIAVPSTASLFATVTNDGPKVEANLDTKWDYELFKKPKAGADTDGSW